MLLCYILLFQQSSFSHTHSLPRLISTSHKHLASPLIGTLGVARAVYLRPDDGTVIIGDMEFDTEDVQAMIEAETWESVIIHEMGHIIGKRKVFVCVL